VQSITSGIEFVAEFGTNLLPNNEIPTVGKTITQIDTEGKVISIDSGSLVSPFVISDTILVTCQGVVYVGVIISVTLLSTEIDLSPNIFPADCFGATSSTTTIQGPITVQHISGPTTSLLVSGSNSCSIKPSILGFGDNDLMWNGGTVLESPYTYRLQATTYILLEMVYPIGSSHIEHRYKNDNRTTILGKIITLFDPFLDRFYPMKATFYTGIKLEYCHFRLLNPDHTLYKLHGHNWQATFRLYTPERQLE
jgi:hypothetical protein